MTIKLQIHNATFVADNQPDMKVQVMPEPNGDVLYSIDNAAGVHVNGHIAASTLLQHAEALQFVADTLGTMVPGRLSPFVRGWISAATDAHHTARQKGFWDQERNNGEMISLLHSELSEALEALRKNDPMDEKIPEFSAVEIELADAVIRIMDLAQARGWRIAQAVEAKMKYNTTRPPKHGKEF